MGRLRLHAPIICHLSIGMNPGAARFAKLTWVFFQSWRNPRSQNRDLGHPSTQACDRLLYSQLFFFLSFPQGICFWSLSNSAAVGTQFPSGMTERKAKAFSAMDPPAHEPRLMRDAREHFGILRVALSFCQFPQGIGFWSLGPCCIRIYQSRVRGGAEGRAPQASA